MVEGILMALRISVVHIWGVDAAAKNPGESETRRNFPTGLVVLSLVVLLVVYPLSAGPICKLGFLSSRSLQCIYFPLDILARHSPGFAKFYSWYIWELWKAGRFD